MIEFFSISPFVVEVILGCLFVLYGLIIGRHISNIMIFWYIARKPDEISGKVTMSHSLVLYLSTYQYLGFAMPVILMVIFAPTPFALGGLLGTGLLMLVHFKWIGKHRKDKNKVK